VRIELPEFRERLCRSPLRVVERAIDVNRSREARSRGTRGLPLVRRYRARRQLLSVNRRERGHDQEGSGDRSHSVRGGKGGKVDRSI
jgi:hypothetical protein